MITTRNKLREEDFKLYIFFLNTKKSFIEFKYWYNLFTNNKKILKK